MVPADTSRIEGMDRLGVGYCRYVRFCFWYCTLDRLGITRNIEERLWYIIRIMSRLNDYQSLNSNLPLQ